jgi:hypothetical protein
VKPDIILAEAALSVDAGKGWVSPEEHGKALNEIEVIAGHAKDMEEELEQVQAEAAAAAAVVRKLTWVDTGTESGRTVFLCATCGCQRNEHHDPGCEILAVENGTAGKALLDKLTRLRDYRRVMVELTLKEREEWKQALVADIRRIILDHSELPRDETFKLVDEALSTDAGKDLLKERDAWKYAAENHLRELEYLEKELEKLRAAAKDVVTSRSVAYFDSDQLSHVYVSVDGALLVKVREALDALEEKP